jgi:hypothetical protein
MSAARSACTRRSPVHAPFSTTWTHRIFGTAVEEADAFAKVLSHILVAALDVEGWRILALHAEGELEFAFAAFQVASQKMNPRLVLTWW